MQETLRILLQRRTEGAIGQYAIGGVIAGTSKYDFSLQQVVNAKAAWRKHAHALTWEDKVAAIERMWVRDAELKKVREQNKASK